MGQSFAGRTKTAIKTKKRATADTKGLPEGPKGRIGLDVWRKDPNVVYARIEHEKESGVYRSDDAGATWRKLSATNPRPMYFSQIRIDPQRLARSGLSLGELADAARQTVEHTGTAGVRIAAQQDRTGHGVTVIGHQLMADALVVTNVMETLDAELFDEGATGDLRRSRLLRRRRHAVIESDDNLFEIGRAHV